MTVLLLSACGFHLRGLGADRISLQEINVTAANQHGETERVLDEALREAGVKLVAADKAPYSVRLLNERSTRRSVATTSDVRVAEYGLKLEVQFELLNAAGKQVIAPTTVSAQRVYSFDSSSLVGSSEEEQQLDTEMRRDVASQIISRIDATVSSQQAKTK